MKLNDLFENKKEIKDRNPVAKELRANPQFKAKTELDKKKREKQGYQKHKNKVEEGHSNTRQQAQTMLKLEELRDMIMVLDMNDNDKTSALTSLDQVADDIAIIEEATIKPYVSMYRDKDNKNKMVYDVLDKHGKSAFKSHDEKEAMKYFKDNYKKMRENTGDLWINGMRDIDSVINMIKDTIQDGKGEDAVDYLGQLQEYLESKGITEASGYQGQMEPHMHIFKTMDFDKIKQIIDDKKIRAYAEKRPDGSVAVHTMNPSRDQLVKVMGITETLEEGIFGKETTKIKQSDPLRVIGNIAMRKDNTPFPVKTRDGEIKVSPTQAQKFMRKFYKSSNFTRNQVLDRLKDMETAKQVFEDEATSQRYAASWRKDNPIGSNWLNPDDYDADAEGIHMITNTRTEMDIFMVPAKNYDEAFDKWLDDSGSGKDNQYYDSTKDYASDHSYWGRKAPEQEDDDDLEDSVQFEGKIMDPQTKQMIPEKDYIMKYVMAKHPEATKKLLQTQDLMDIYDTELYMDLFDYFSEEMPYGTQKARDGDPVQYMQDELDMMGMFDGREGPFAMYGKKPAESVDESEVNNLLNRSNRNRDNDIARLTQLAGLAPKDVPMEDYSKMTKDLITKLVNDGMSDEEIQSRTGETSKRIEIIRKHVEDEATDRAQMAYKLARDEGETAEATQDLARQLNPMKSAVDTNQSPAVTAKGLDAISKGERPTPNQIKAVEPYVSKLAKAISNPQTAAQMRNVFKKVQ